MNGKQCEAGVEFPRTILRHPICRGDYLALVFSGARDRLGELPGELTWRVPYKFALEDPRLPARDDLARATGTALQTWPEDRVRPCPGVCFVFADEDHPALADLQRAGAAEGEHYLVVDRILNGREAMRIEDRVARFLADAQPKDPVFLLGYGDQGQRIARHLIDQADSWRDRIIVIDHGTDSSRRAAADGLRICDPGAVEHGVSPIIYSPLFQYERLHELARRAAAGGRAVLDNSIRSGGGRLFIDRGHLKVDAGADRALRLDGAVVKPAGHGLPVPISVVRESKRCLGGVTVPYLHGGYRQVLGDPNAAFNLLEPDVQDRLAGESCQATVRTYITLQDEKIAGVFAAHDFCAELFPDATEAVLPSGHFIDLPATSLERLILRHLERREIAMASQTSAEQTALGVIARHYASDRAIIEIGSALGGSAVLMAAATEEHRPIVISIDPDTVDRDVMRFAFEREGQADRLLQIVRTSNEAVGKVREYAGRVGLVFIDGLHTSQAVLRDFINYAPLLQQGGAIAFHDVSPAWCTVLRTVIEHVIPDPRFEIKCLVDSLAVFERR